MVAHGALVAGACGGAGEPEEGGRGSGGAGREEEERCGVRRTSTGGKKIKEKGEKKKE